MLKDLEIEIPGDDPMNSSRHNYNQADQLTAEE